jgi:hypothetical protein
LEKQLRKLDDRLGTRYTKKRKKIKGFLGQKNLKQKIFV